MTDELDATLRAVRSLIAGHARDAARYRDELLPGAPQRYNDFEAREKAAELTLWLVALADDLAACERGLTEMLGP